MELSYKLRIIILLFSISLSVTFCHVSANENYQQSVPCKQGWYFFEDFIEEKCYKILPLGSSEGLNWTDSIESCKSEGGNLTSIHSNKLQEFLTVFLLLNSKTNAWIGLNDIVTEREYVWLDGSEYYYTNWDKYQPKRNRLKEDCVLLQYKGFKDAVGKWKAEVCTTSIPHICQIDKSDDTQSLDPRFCTIEEGGGWKYLNSCYHIVEEEKSWEDAEKYCEEHYKGYLVSVLDDNAELFLNHIMKLSDLSKDVWIGIKMGNYSTQKWTSGWHVANKKFNYKGLEFQNGTCVVKKDMTSWEITPCLNEYSFICEKIKYNVPVLQNPPSDAWECPDTENDWLDLGGDFCYYIEKGKLLNWFDANYECGKLGGTLACIHSENETNVLHPHVLDTKEGLMIGLKRNIDNMEIFEWADGTNVTYENWDEGEPNSLKEKCGELYTESMKWNDIDCKAWKSYICQTRKRFSRSKLKELLDKASCNSTLSTDHEYSKAP